MNTKINLDTKDNSIISQVELEKKELHNQREIIINNLPFLFVRLLFGILTILGLISIIMENLDDSKSIIFCTVGIIIYVFSPIIFIRRINVHRLALKQINNEWKSLTSK